MRSTRFFVSLPLFAACSDASGLARDTTGNPKPPFNNGNSNVNLGGAQDFGYFRRLLDSNIVPDPDVIDEAGFFAEHHTPLPEPSCGERVCVQAMLGVMGNLINGSNCSMLQIGLNSPIVANPDLRPPLSLSVVVDTSGSMEAAGKMDFVIQGLRRMVNELSDADRIALVRYSSDAEVLVPMGDVGRRRNELQSAIEGLRADGSTNLWGGLELGYGESLGAFDSGRQNRVLLLSDGQPTAGITDTAEILRRSRAYNSDGIGITSIGLGTDFNLELMRGLAEQGDGNFYFVEDAGAVEEVFTEELSYFTVPIAYDLELDVRAGRDFEFRSSHGSSFFEAEAWGGHLSIPSVFIAHRDSHEDMTEEGGRRGGGSALLVELMPNPSSTSDESEVATVDVSYRVPGEDRIATDSIAVRYPYPASTLLDRGFFDDDIVTKSFVMLNILVGIEESCTRFHLGDGDGAVAMLRRLIAAARDYEDSANGGMGDADIRSDIELMQQLADVEIANGALDPPNPPIPEDPWPRD
jgi:Ca-activated chloride channel family protein